MHHHCFEITLLSKNLRCKFLCSKHVAFLRLEWSLHFIFVDCVHGREGRYQALFLRIWCFLNIRHRLLICMYDLYNGTFYKRSISNQTDKEKRGVESVCICAAIIFPPFFTIVVIFFENVMYSATTYTEHLDSSRLWQRIPFGHLRDVRKAVTEITHWICPTAYAWTCQTYVPEVLEPGESLWVDLYCSHLYRCDLVHPTRDNASQLCFELAMLHLQPTVMLTFAIQVYGISDGHER